MLQMVLRVEQLHRILMTIEIAGLSQHPGITDTSALDMGIQEKQADRLSDSSEIQMWSLGEAYLKVFEKKASCLGKKKGVRRTNHPALLAQIVGHRRWLKVELQNVTSPYLLQSQQKAEFQKGQIFLKAETNIII